jgi:hypothetical protein
MVFGIQATIVQSVLLPSPKSQGSIRRMPNMARSGAWIATNHQPRTYAETAPYHSNIFESATDDDRFVAYHLLPPIGGVRIVGSIRVGRAAVAPKGTRGIVSIGPPAVVPKIAKLRAFEYPNLIERSRSVGKLCVRWCGKR